GSQTRTSVYFDCRREMRSNGFPGLHLDSRTMPVFWRPILCKVASGLDLARVASHTFVTARYARHTPPKTGWGRVMSTTFGSIGKARSGPLPKAASAD